MLVRPSRLQQTNRGTTQVGTNQSSAPLTFPAPTGGLVTNADIAGQQSGNATILENWWPTLTGARIRGGSVKRGLAADGGPIVSMFRYLYAGTERLFAATGTRIYDMSSPAAPPTTTAASVSSLTSGDWSTFQQTNSGQSYLVCFNGTDPRQLYNGTTWSTTPAITFTDSTTMANLSFGWVFKNRQFFVKGGSLDAYYLTTLNAVGGATAVFPLGGVMRKGGSLLFGFSWSVESGAGPNEYCVFVSTEGEVAVYSGSNPADANDFALVGVYNIGKPLGKNAFIKSGGDALIATMDGLIPLSQVFNRDRQQVSLVALSRPIEDLWKAAAIAQPSGWTITLWPEQNIVFVAFPSSLVMPDVTFVFSALTGKWSTTKNWLANCYSPFQGSLFFGSIGGYVYRGDFTGMDDGLSFTATYLSSFSPVGGYGQRKTATMGVMNLKASEKPTVRLFARADLDLDPPVPPNVSLNTTGLSIWDTGLWDQAKWDGGGITMYNFRYRQNVRAAGDYLALGCVVTSAGDVKLNAELDLGLLQVATGESSS